MRHSSWRGLGATATLAALLIAGLSTAAEPVTEMISDVEIRQEDGATQIVLRGAEEPIYTAFMREDPPSLVVELYDVTFQSMNSPIQVGDGTVQQIAFTEQGDGEIGAILGRMTVDLAQDSDYEVIPSGGQIIVKVWPRDWETRILQASNAAPPTPADAADLREQVRKRVAKAKTHAPVPAAPAALDPAEASLPHSSDASETRSRITQLKSSEDQILIDASGPIDNVDSFLLDSPNRLVIDFWGAENGLAQPRYEVKAGAIQQVRIGTHPEKVRVVIDLRGPISSHRIEPAENGVRIELALAGEQAETRPDPSEVADDAVVEVPDLPEFVPEIERVPEIDLGATERTQSETEEIVRTIPPVLPWKRSAALRGTVSSVHFESVDQMDRVVVRTTGNPELLMVQPDSVTVVLDLPYVSIAKDAERRVDTREFGGPVEQVSAFRTPDLEIEQARIVVKHHATSRPMLVDNDGEWILEFAQHDAPRAAVQPYPGAATPSRAAAPWVGAVPAAPASDARATPESQTVSHTEPAPYTRMGQGHASTAAGFPQAAPANLDVVAAVSPAAIDLLREGRYSAEKHYAGRRISLDFKDADIASILRLIAEVSDLNIVAGEEVKGEVTVRLVDVPWDQALDVVLLTKGLGFLRVGNVLRIAPIDLLQQEEEARLSERRAKEKLQDLVVKLQPVNYADVKEIEGMVARLLTERGTVQVDRRTSTLIIKDIPSVIQESTALVKAIDTQTPQVLIEAKIVEANLEFSRSLGAIWGFGYNPLGANNSTHWPTGGSPGFHLGDGSNDSLISGGSQGSNFLVSNPVSSAVGTLTAGLLGLADRLQLDLSLQAAEANNEGKVISSPRVLTLDNTEATIQQGVAIAFESTTENSINTNFVDAVLELKVTPHITADRSIVMKIKVSRNAPQLQSGSGEVVGITKNETETEALVVDGQTMVLGGIYVVNKSDATSGVPYLSSIPVLGAIFKGNEKRDNRQELLIFVTPRIVNPKAPAS